MLFFDHLKNKAETIPPTPPTPDNEEASGGGSDDDNSASAEEDSGVITVPLPAAVVVKSLETSLQILTSSST
jgi:hypothetical protein